MTKNFAYGDTDWPVREDLQRAHRHAFSELSKPGTWWTGAERLAIADETRRARHCQLCQDKKQALSPNMATGTHDGAGLLPEAAVDAVHRITTDPGRLSEAWVKQLLKQGLSDAQYIELVGVVTTIMAIDAIHHALGMEVEQLPSAGAGEPTRERPGEAKKTTNWLPIAPNALIPKSGKKRRRTPRAGNVMMALSLVPDEIDMLFRQAKVHYLTEKQMLDFSSQPREITRDQIEFAAARVSVLNKCFY